MKQWMSKPEILEIQARARRPVHWNEVGRSMNRKNGSELICFMQMKLPCICDIADCVGKIMFRIPDHGEKVVVGRASLLVGVEYFALPV